MPGMTAYFGLAWTWSAKKQEKTVVVLVPPERRHGSWPNCQNKKVCKRVVLPVGVRLNVATLLMSSVFEWSHRVMILLEMYEVFEKHFALKALMFF